jgi:hypothetical protein
MGNGKGSLEGWLPAEPSSSELGLRFGFGFEVGVE